ncbi:MAG TPA: hypothetical protein VLH84_01185 [Patescibacteria group bacterium]|nr:hypothetical protein [Patescibacteria group bacterium]
MTEQARFTPERILTEEQVGRERWLTDATTELNTLASVVDPTVIGLKEVEGERTRVPAVFELPDEKDRTKAVALVRREDAKTGETHLVLQGLKQTRRGLRPVGRGVELAIPEEAGVDGMPGRPYEVTIGNGEGAISRDLLFSRRLRPNRPSKTQFGERLGEGALRLTIGANAKVFVANTEDARTIRGAFTPVADTRFTRGRVVVNPLFDERHAEYITPEEGAERRRLADEAEVRRKEQQMAERRRYQEEREHKIFAPRVVPDLTAGEYLPSGYGGLYVSEQSRDYSRPWASQALYRDSAAEAIIRDVLGETPPTSYEERQNWLMDAVRTNPELRLRLGKLYAERISREVHHMGRNINSQNVKKPNSPGYENLHLSGVEYAAMLALSHLDGTFNPGKESVLAKDDELNENGWPLIDQHRAAARWAIDGQKPADRLRFKRQLAGEEASRRLRREKELAQLQQAQAEQDDDTLAPVA